MLVLILRVMAVSHSPVGYVCLPRSGQIGFMICAKASAGTEAPLDLSQPRRPPPQATQPNYPPLKCVLGPFASAFASLALPFDLTHRWCSMPTPWRMRWLDGLSLSLSVSLR